MPKSIKLFQQVCGDSPKNFANDGEVLFCLMCDEKVNASQISQVTQYLHTVKHLEQCDAEEAQSIENVQKSIAKPNIKTDLGFIRANFECLSLAITKIETKGFLLVDAIYIFDSIRPTQDFRFLSGGTLDMPNEYIENLSPTELEAFKHAPAVSCDVERTFSLYKRVLEDWSTIIFNRKSSKTCYNSQQF